MSECNPFAAERHEMVETQLRARGITDERVLRRMELLPRHAFVPPALARQAYADEALPVEAGQTISQPYVVAFMTQALRVEDDSKVLEIGTGTGYQTALLAALTPRGKVYTVERMPELAQTARDRLTAMGYDNIVYHVGDGSAGWPGNETFDRILVTAAAPRETAAHLARQLADRGIMVIPEGSLREQVLTIMTRRGTALVRTMAFDCRFVPLVGSAGWPAEETPNNE